MTRMAVLMYTMSTEIHLAKDPCSYAYYLARECGWETSYVYFNTYQLHDDEFEKYCRLVHLGDESDFRKEIAIGQKWLKENAMSLDVLMLFNYGTSTYRTANYAKKINPNLKIWCKLDMSEGGFSHFYDGTISRKIKSMVERIKGHNIDLYTVENKQFFDVLKNHIAFKSRIEYLPNCVSFLNVKRDEIDKGQTKEKICLTVGRIGDKNKNNELFLNAIRMLPDDILAEWKFYFVGPYTESFCAYVEKCCLEREMLRETVVLLGGVYEREKLYEIYQKSRFFILTSFSEGFNVSVIEAMYFGCYPILTHYGRSVMDVTDNGRLGTILKGYTAEELENVMSHLLNRADVNTHEEIKAYARKNYSYEHWSKVLAGYIDKLLV